MSSVVGPTMPYGRQQMKPPDKGSFPIDHDGECKAIMVKYMKCLGANKRENAKCRQESKDYLECRMDKNLMLREEWDNLGFGDIAGSKKTT